MYIKFSDIDINDILKHWREEGTTKKKQCFTLNYRNTEIDLDVDCSDIFIDDISAEEEFLLRSMVYTDVEMSKIVYIIDMMYEEYIDSKYKDKEFLEFLADLNSEELQEIYYDKHV